MDTAIVVGLGSILAVAILDFVLASRWNHFYFKVGVPVFVRRIERPQGIQDLSLPDLSTSSKTAAAAPLLFHRIDPTTVAFREPILGGVMHYVPIMHGVIRHDVAEGVVRVMGVLNWFAIVFVVSFAILMGRKFVEIVPMLGLVFGVIYFIQAVRYNRVAKKLRISTPR